MKIKFFLIALLATGISFSAFGIGYSALVKSIADGDWNSNLTWDKGSAPSSVDVVEISHTITFNMLSTEVDCSTINIKNSGILKFDQAVDSRTLIVAGDINIESGGQFLMPPNTGYISTLAIKCDSAGQYGIIVNDGGVFDIRGNPMDYWRMELAAGVNAGATVIATDNISNWKIGDIITIGTTAGKTETEERTISAIDGANITISSLTYAHSAGAEIVNINRNSVIKSSDTSNKAYIKNLSQTETNFNMVWAEAIYFGVSYGEKCGINFYGAGTRGKINYCSVHNGYMGVAFDSSSDNTLADNGFYANSTGISIGGSNNIVSGNSSYGNLYGISVGGDNNVVRNNRAYSSLAFHSKGIRLASSSGNILTGNICYANYYGMESNNADYNTFHNNTAYLNEWSGINFNGGSDNNIVNANTTYSNYPFGIEDTWGGNILSNNSSYLNGWGINSTVYRENMILNCDLGKGGDNSIYDIFRNCGHTSKTIMKECNLRSDRKVNIPGYTPLSSYIVSYNQNGSKGDVKIWGNYVVSSGNTLQFNYSDLLYDSTATFSNV